MKKRYFPLPLAAAALLMPLTAHACADTCCTACNVPLCCTTESVNNSSEAFFLPMSQTTASAADEIFRQTNAYRAQNGLSPLRRDPLLEQAAAVRAEEIARRFSHTRPDGSHWSTVSAAAAGENIARGHRTADKAMAAWMTSSGHRANILRGSFTSIGVAAVQINGVMHYVQLFGR